VLPLMQSSLLEPMRAIARGDSLAGAAALTFSTRAAVTTVVAAGGYPGKVQSGDAITLPAPETDVIVFHAGTVRDTDGVLRTSGGRVLTVTALGDTVADAQQRSVQHAQRIRFDGAQLRRDIGWREVARRAGAP